LQSAEITESLAVSLDETLQLHMEDFFNKTINTITTDDIKITHLRYQLRAHQYPEQKSQLQARLSDMVIAISQQNKVDFESTAIYNQLTDYTEQEIMLVQLWANTNFDENLDID
jgi:hypothetical protein